MLEIVREVKANAERELLLAQAKLEVATAILEKYAIQQVEVEAAAVEEETVEEETEQYQGM